MSRTLYVVCCGMLAVAAVPAAQRRVPSGAERPTVTLTVALQAGGGAYQFTGQGTCTYAPTASIYGILSEQWNVQQSGDSRSLALTLWKPKSGSDRMFTLSISSGTGRQNVSTVKAAGAPDPQGSGTVAFESDGKGGTFTVNAKDARGGAITGTIKCDRLTPAIAEGGH